MVKTQHCEQYAPTHGLAIVDAFLKRELTVALLAKDLTL